MSLRNIAIIAHVDHGKTTLVDQLLAQSGVFRANEATVERAMDSNDQERERGITILAKCTSVLWRGAAGETRINIIDTPGHADFGGEVERILGMVDGCVLLVDAEEGVMPQTKFVLGKALKMGLRPILCLNKVDRPHADPDRVLNDAFDLFAAMGATDEQLDFPHIYASGKNGWATLDLNQPNDNLAPLFDLIVDHVPPPKAEARKGAPFQILSVLIENDPYLGRLLTGRVESGRFTPGQAIHALSRDGAEVERGRVTKILAFRGLKRQPIVSVVRGERLHPMAQRDRIDRPLPARFDHRRDDLRMPLQVALAVNRARQRPAALLGRHRRERIRGGHRVAFNRYLMGSAGRRASQHQRAKLRRMAQRQLLRNHPAHRDPDNVRRREA